MRTDSVNLSVEAVEEIRALIAENYGAKNVPKNPGYLNQIKNAQEAHEAIRPTSPRHLPNQIKNYLSVEQYKCTI